MRNLDTGAVVVPGNLADFRADIQAGNLVLTIPCYAAPSGSGSVWKMTTYNTKLDGKRLYCDYLESPPPLLKPAVVWHGTMPITIKDPEHDVMDLTHQKDGIADRASDIETLTVQFHSSAVSIKAHIFAFPPPVPSRQA